MAKGARRAKHSTSRSSCGAMRRRCSKAALASAGFVAVEASITMDPTTTVALTGNQAEQMLRLADSLEDLDDVQNFYANFDISAKEMAQFA